MAEVYRFPHRIVAIVGLAESLFQKLTQQPDVRAYLERAGKQIGGYVTIARADGLPLATFGLGSVAYENTENCHTFSLEKAHRLAGHAAVHDHRLSRQSANKAEFKYAGAVLGKEYIVSFSGLPSALDEIYAAALLCLLGDAAPRYLQDLLQAHDNEWLTSIDFNALTVT